MGIGKNSGLHYIIDYGLAKKYRDTTNRIHIPYREHKKLTGTARYASLFTHLGIEQSRRDDMECLGFTLVYLLKGKLPWQGIRAKNEKKKYDKIKDMKQKISPETICKNLPQEFVYYIQYCRSLKFEDKPDYAQLKKMFRDLFYRKHYNCNFEYDWILLNALNNVEITDSIPSEGTQVEDCMVQRCTKLVNNANAIKIVDINTPQTIFQHNESSDIKRSSSHPLKSIIRK